MWLYICFPGLSWISDFYNYINIINSSLIIKREVVRCVITLSSCQCWLCGTPSVWVCSLESQTLSFNILIFKSNCQDSLLALLFLRICWATPVVSHSSSSCHVSGVKGDRGHLTKNVSIRSSSNNITAECLLCARCCSRSCALTLTKPLNNPEI